jgi:hypothetical protein
LDLGLALLAILGVGVAHAAKRAWKGLRAVRKEICFWGVCRWPGDGDKKARVRGGSVGFGCCEDGMFLKLGVDVKLRQEDYSLDEKSRQDGKRLCMVPCCKM